MRSAVMRKFLRHVHAKIHTKEPFTHNDAKQMQRCTQTYNSQAQLPSLTSLSVCLSLSHKPTHTREVSCVSASLSGAATAACLWAQPLPKPPRCGRKRESKKKVGGRPSLCSMQHSIWTQWPRRWSRGTNKAKEWATEAPEEATHLIQNFSSVRGKKGGKGISHLVFLAAASALLCL